MRLAGFTGWDTPAHLYKIATLRQGGALLWDNEWYGGAYQMVSYGFVFYWLAQFINYSVLVVASAAVLPILFYVYMRRIYGVTGVLPAAALAVVLAVYLANGQDPFLFALALTMGGLGGRRLRPAARRRRAHRGGLLCQSGGGDGRRHLPRGAVPRAARAPRRAAAPGALPAALLPCPARAGSVLLGGGDLPVPADRGRRLRVVRRGRRGRRPAVARPRDGRPRRLCSPPSASCRSPPWRCRPTPWAAPSGASSSCSACRCCSRCARCACRAWRWSWCSPARRSARSSCRPPIS